MKTTYQFKNQSVLEHGQSVHKTYLEIIKALDNNEVSYYNLPKELLDHWQSIKPLLYKQELMEVYHTYHDCGKPFCRVVDENGKQHFPNHAEVSARIYRETFYKNKLIEKLIASDMVFHSSSMEDIRKFIKENNINFQFSLWLTSFAEIYSNKLMFDVDNQTSFKIKYKKLNKILKLIINEKDNITCQDIGDTT